MMKWYLDFSAPALLMSPFSRAYRSGRRRESDASSFLGAVSKLLTLWAKWVYWNLSFSGTGATLQTWNRREEGTHAEKSQTTIHPCKIAMSAPSYASWPRLANRSGMNDAEMHAWSAWECEPDMENMHQKVHDLWLRNEPLWAPSPEGAPLPYHTADSSRIRSICRSLESWVPLLHYTQIHRLHIDQPWKGYTGGKSKLILQHFEMESGHPKIIKQMIQSKSPKKASAWYEPSYLVTGTHRNKILCTL